MIPLYENEMEFKLSNNIDVLFENMPENIAVVDINRPNMFNE